MKKNSGNLLYIIFLLGVFILLQLTVGFAEETSTTKQLPIINVTNPGFEKSLLGWDIYGNVKPTSSKTHSDSKAMLLRSSSNQNAALWQVIFTNSGANAPKSGQRLRLSAWILIDPKIDCGKGSFLMRVESLNAAKEKTMIAAFDGINDQTEKGKWIRIETGDEKKVLSDAQQVVISFENNFVGATYGDVMVDDVQLEVIQ
jgi:hypothetical protein